MPAGNPVAGQTTVTTSATRIVPVAALQGRVGAPVTVVFSTGAASANVIFGDNAVTTATGLPLPSNQQLSIDTTNPETIYGIVAAATQPVGWMIFFTS